MLMQAKLIGIDITHLAITLIKKRLRDSFGEAIDRSRATVGEPVSLPDLLAILFAFVINRLLGLDHVFNGRPCEQSIHFTHGCRNTARERPSLGFLLAVVDAAAILHVKQQSVQQPQQDRHSSDDGDAGQRPQNSSH